MPVWRAFIDDSGSDGAPLYPDFTKRPVDPMDGTTKVQGMISPVTTVGIVAFNTNHCLHAARNLLDFRRDIQKRYEIEWPTPPKIHMRHLYGNGGRRDKKKNPFYGLSEGKRHQIIRESYKILLEGMREYRPRLTFYDESVVESRDANFDFFNSDRMRLEREIIYSRFAKDQVAEKYFKLVMHPTMSLISRATVGFSDFCTDKGADGIINYDSSEAAKGFDVPSFFEVMHESGWMRNIRYDSHTESVNECLLQLADMLSYYGYRQALAIHRGDTEFERDPFAKLAEVMRPEFKKGRQEEPVPHLDVAAHYLVARRHLEVVDAAWVNTHMKTHAELRSDLAANTGMGGVPAVRNASAAYFQKHGKLT